MFLHDRDPGNSAVPASVDRASWQRDFAMVQAALRRDPESLDGFIQRMSCVPRFVACLDGKRVPPLSREEIEDLVQDVLATVWRRLGDFRGEASLETWVFRICDFQLRNSRRRAASRSAVPLADVGEPATDEVDHPGYDVERLRLGIDALPDAEAEVVRLKHLHDLTFDQIATTLEQSPNTIKTRYYRGLETLRRWLKRTEVER
ncbi:MAG: RNA polymerase sigma factor [Planctomycetes bacterium]|nr:RNA polymerase sigma factor [Planctomycetota bacterium]